MVVSRRDIKIKLHILNINTAAYSNHFEYNVLTCLISQVPFKGDKMGNVVPGQSPLNNER